MLENYSKLLEKNKRKIVQENLKDIKACKRKELIDRLLLDNIKIENIRHSIDQITKFKDNIFPLKKVNI